MHLRTISRQLAFIAGVPTAYAVLSFILVVSSGPLERLVYLLALPSSAIVVDLLRVHDYVILVLCGSLQHFAVCIGIVLWLRCRSKRQYAEFACKKCGYCLVGVVSDCCPECGDNLWKQVGPGSQ